MLFAEFIYNQNKYIFTKVNPFYVYTGYEFKINFKMKNEFQLRKVSAVQDQLKHLQQIRKMIAKNLRYT